MKKISILTGLLFAVSACVTDMGTTEDGRAIKRVGVTVYGKPAPGQFIMSISSQIASIRKQMAEDKEALVEPKARAACGGDFEIKQYEDGKITQSSQAGIYGTFGAIVYCAK